MSALTLETALAFIPWVPGTPSWIWVQYLKHEFGNYSSIYCWVHGFYIQTLSFYIAWCLSRDPVVCLRYIPISLCFHIINFAVWDENTGCAVMVCCSIVLLINIFIDFHLSWPLYRDRNRLWSYWRCCRNFLSTWRFSQKQGSEWQLTPFENPVQMMKWSASQKHWLKTGRSFFQVGIIFRSNTGSTVQSIIMAHIKGCIGHLELVLFISYP